MLKNYFKIAIAVLKRKKFFTFISLFGISFTLTIIIVLTAFLNHIASAGYPDVNRDRELYIAHMQLQNSKGGWTMSGPPSLWYINSYLTKLKTPEKVAFMSINSTTNAFKGDKKLVLNMKYTNDSFWQVEQFDFVEGRPYTKQQLDSREKVAIISVDTRNNYFGEGVSVVGKYLDANNDKYKIIGVVKNVPATMFTAYSDIYLPYTLSRIDIHNQNYTGTYFAILLAKTVDDLPRMRSEYDIMASKLKTNNKDFDKIYTFADKYVEVFSRTVFAGGQDGSTLGYLYLAVAFLAVLFMLLPTINLVNINITRIIERSSEIGVRKAFGASSRTLVYQFLVENMVLTAIGGLLGIVLSSIILQLVNSANLVDNMHLTINMPVLLYSLLACAFFGLLSGVLPAWRMSKLNIVTALKAQ